MMESMQKKICKYYRFPFKYVDGSKVNADPVSPNY